MTLLIPFVFSITAYLITTAIYNIFFHPLAKTPGPFFSRISSIPSFLHACRGDRHVWIWKNFQIYGDKFRAAPNLVLFNSARAHGDIYGPRANNTRSRFYKTWKRAKDDVHTVNATEPAIHAKRRKLLNLIFTEQSLKAASPLVAAHIDRWIELLLDTAAEGSKDVHEKPSIARSWSRPLDMPTWVDHLAFDILGDLYFGENFNTKEPGENKMKKIPPLIIRNVAAGYKISQSPFLDLVLFLQPLGLYKLMERLRPKELEEYGDFVEASVDKRVAAHKAGPNRERQDMFHFLLEAIDPDTKQPAFQDRRHLLAETRLLVVAGTDTTSEALCALLFYLAHNPEALAKAVSEVRSTFSSPSEIVYGPTLSRCKYLRACVDEVLRLSNPAPSELPREVLSGGITIDGSHYPAGTIVGCSSWSMGRNESVYGDAHTYRPERWIPTTGAEDEDSEARVRTIKKAFHPFSIGPFNCVGQNLAILELLLVSAKVMWSLDFRLAPVQGSGRNPQTTEDDRNHNHFEVKDVYLCLKDGPELQFRPRAESI